MFLRCVSVPALSICSLTGLIPTQATFVIIKTRVVKHFYPDIIDSLATSPSGSDVAKMCLGFCLISESLRIRVVIRYHAS